MNEITQRINYYQLEMLADLEALIKLPSVRDLTTASEQAPFGHNIRHAFDTFLKIGERHGFQIADFSGYACHLIHGNQPDYVGVLGHLDVVAAGESSLWETPPFQLTQKGDMLFGRGVNDDKGPLIAALYALKVVKDMQIPLKYAIRIIAGGAEETTWECMGHYFQRNPQPIMGFSPDGNFPIVNGEKGILQYQVAFDQQIKQAKNSIIAIECKEERDFVCDEVTLELHQVDFAELKQYLSAESHIEIKNNHVVVTYQGIRSLSRNPQRGENALWKLAKDLHNFPFAQRGMNRLLKYLNKYYTDDFYGKKLGLFAEDNEMGSTSICPMSITHTKEQFQLNVDYRYHKSIDLDKVLERLKKQTSAKISILKQRDTLYVPADSQLVQSLKQAYQTVTGEEAAVLTKGGASYARVLENGIAFGATFDGETPRPHMPNEQMPLSSLLKACEIYVHALINLAGDC